MDIRPDNNSEGEEEGSRAGRDKRRDSTMQTGEGSAQPTPVVVLRALFRKDYSYCFCLGPKKEVDRDNRDKEDTDGARSGDDYC